MANELIAQKSALEKENAELKAQNTELIHKSLAGDCKAPDTDILENHGGVIQKGNQAK